MSNYTDLKIKYQMDEQVHPTGRAWEWWEVKAPAILGWTTCMDPPDWHSPYHKYRRRDCAPTVYDDHGVVRLMDDDTCDGWDKAVSPTTVVTTEPVRVGGAEWTKTLTDDPEEAAILNDLVDHPYHYAGQGEIECIEVLEQLARDGHDFRILNAMKYLWRYRHKGGAESLEKAIWYIERVIGDME